MSLTDTQKDQVIYSVINWNELRYKREFNLELTLSLLNEERNELVNAFSNIDKYDALGDILFVTLGAFWKLGIQQTNQYRMYVDTLVEKIIGEQDEHYTKDIEVFVPFETIINKVPNEHAALFGVIDKSILDIVRIFEGSLSPDCIWQILGIICHSNNTKFVDKVNFDIKANTHKGKDYKSPTKDLSIFLQNRQQGLYIDNYKFVDEEYLNAPASPVVEEPASPVVDAFKLCSELAAKSTAKKRKVGAVILDKEGAVIGEGYNTNSEGTTACEDADGNTYSTVVHAEIAALKQATERLILTDALIYITHPPCSACKAAILKAGIKEENIHVMINFIKFDKDKLRYELIPVEATAAIARVLTYGAKKYKPDNWKQCENPDRFIGALYRHLEAHRSGEINDKDSGLSHMSHVLTNAAFLEYFISNEISTETDKNITTE